MNLFNHGKGDRYNHGLLARPTGRYPNPATPGPHYQRSLLNGNHYVSSEVFDAPLLQHEQGSHFQQPYDASYSYDRFPIDDRATEDLKHQLHYHSRTPGYVTSFDTTPAQPLPHSSLSSSSGSEDGMYDEHGRYTSNAYTRHSPYMMGMPNEELYGGGDWSSDGSSDTSRGRGYRRGHRPQVGQRRMTDLGREVFNGVAWVAEEDYLHDAAVLSQHPPVAGHSPPYHHGRMF